MPLPAKVVELLRDRDSVAARYELLALGFSGDTIDGWAYRGWLERLERGVYGAPGVPRTPRRLLRSRLLRARPRAVADAEASLGFHQIEGFSVPDEPGVIVPPARVVTGVTFPVTPAVIPAADRTTLDGMPALTVARGLIELPVATPDRRLRVALDSGRRQGLVSPSWLGRRARALPDHPGAERILGLLASGRADPETEGEREMQIFLATLGMNLEWGVTDLVPGRRLDAAERASMVAFEFDGRDHHVLPTDRDADGIRDLECEVHGVLVIRITSGMLRDAPEVLRRHIEQIRWQRLLERNAAAS